MNPSQPAAAANPGKNLGIASFIVSLLGVGLIGLILGIIAKSKSKSAGLGNGFALAGIIIGIINIVAFLFIVAVVAYNGVAAVAEKCSELGAGTHVVDNVTYTCGAADSSSAY